MKTETLERFAALHQKLVSESEILQQIRNQKADSVTRVITFVNPYSFFKLIDSDLDLGKIDYIGVDAISLVGWLKLFGLSLTRSSMDQTSLFIPLIEAADQDDHKIFAFGSTVERAKLAEKNLNFIERKDALIRVQTGYFQSEIPGDYFDAIESSKYVLVSVGSVLQEKFSIRLKDEFRHGRLIFTSGAFIDQSSQSAHYYPININRYNLRWLYRLFNEKHVRKRIIVDYPRFFVRYIFITAVIKYKKWRANAGSI